MLRLHEECCVDIALSSEGKLGKGRGLQVLVATDQRGSFQPFSEGICDKGKYSKTQTLHLASLDFPMILKQKEKIYCLLVD